jgi:hypothetical protein
MNDKKLFIHYLVNECFPRGSVNPGHLIIGIPNHQPLGSVYGVIRTTKVSVGIHDFSNGYTAEKDIFYDRFKMADYLSKGETYIEVPAIASTNEIELINYMNTRYLHPVSLNEGEMSTSLQWEIHLDSLQPFSLSYPQPGDTLTLQAKPDSYVLEGSLEIRFT